MSQWEHSGPRIAEVDRLLVIMREKAQKAVERDGRYFKKAVVVGEVEVIIKQNSQTHSDEMRELKSWLFAPPSSPVTLAKLRARQGTRMNQQPLRANLWDGSPTICFPESPTSRWMEMQVLAWWRRRRFLLRRRSAHAQKRLGVAVLVDRQRMMGHVAGV